ncbi:MAG: bifunctional 4-hydroxy-2-oxoglutarate aldolase/2-dehydro-3-deoxy-phosphogluconate aldolase [Maritimibacter sp.]|nr:bifunctional 4-hydroxy-2-oxoglutarate aldolase/2-dehydro-3-deoxy-phosphogluconate aldolase [Maritimibacter sp.]
MKSADVINAISKARLVPVVVLESATQAVPLARALVAGGLPVAEVTFRTPAAADAIRAIAQAVPEILLGAGTVLTPDQAEAAKDAGAKFLVTPGFNPDVVRKAQSLDLPIVPGVNNPSHVEQAMSMGLEVLKFFPAEASGGVAMLKALKGPYPGIRFVPTGGVGAGNVADYLRLPNVVACGGSWMVDPVRIAAGDFDAIIRLTREAMDVVRAV